jgi:hypothetical protein
VEKDVWLWTNRPFSLLLWIWQRVDRRRKKALIGKVQVAPANGTKMGRRRVSEEKVDQLLCKAPQLNPVKLL